MYPTITFAVVGFGHIGRRHASIINQFPGCKLVAIVDSSEQALNNELYPAGVPSFSSMSDMFTAGILPDVVNIATPNGYHCALAVEALRHNAHVVIEKPMGLNKFECEDVIYTALQMSRQVFVVKQNRYSPPSRWLKEVVSSGALGENLMNIQAKVRNFTHKDMTEFEDSGLVQFEFVNGGIGSINFSTSLWDTNMESSITVIGTKGSVKVGGQYMNEIEYCHIKDYIMPELPPTNPPNDYGPFKGSAANHHYLIENVINTLQGKDTITANALEGLKVVDIIQRIYQAAQQ